MKKILFSLLLLSASVFAQENVNGNRYFLGALDASQSPHTSPIRVVTSLPGTCNATTKEQVLLSTNSTVYICTSSNTWTSVLSASLLGVTNGIAPLDSNALIPKQYVPGLSNLNGSLNLSQLNVTGTPTATTFLRGDGSWAVPPTGSGSYTLTPATTSVLGGVTVPTTGGLSVTTAGALSVKYGTSSSTAAVGNDSRFGKATTIQGFNWSTTAPADGQVPTWVQADGQYEPKTPVVSTGGGSGSTTSPVYFNGNINSDGSYSVGTDCSASNSPCKFRSGSVVTIFNGPYKIVPATGAQGTALVYFETGNIHVGGTAPMNSASSTPGLVFDSGVNSFPTDSIPQYTCTIGSVSNAGQFDPNGCTDYRAIYNIKNVTAAVGGGIMVSENATTGISNLSVDPTLVGLRVLTAPSTSSSACTVGQWSFDSSYYYLCTATNTWKRMTLSTF